MYKRQDLGGTAISSAAQRLCVAGGSSGDLRVFSPDNPGPVSYTHLRAPETVLDLVCRLLLENKNADIPFSLLLPDVTQTNHLNIPKTTPNLTPCSTQ
mgnify:CR=1 FL=1